MRVLHVSSCGTCGNGGPTRLLPAVHLVSCRLGGALVLFMRELLHVVLTGCSMPSPYH